MLLQNNLQNNKGLSKPTYSLENIASFIDGELVGDPNQLVSSLGSLQHASKDCISFVSSKKFESFIRDCSAGAIIVKKSFKPSDNKNYILVKDPYFAFAILSEMFDPIEDMFEGIDFSNNINSKAEVADSVKIYQGAVIADTAQIRQNVLIGPNAFVGPDCIVGEGTVIHANSTLMRSVTLGKNCIVQNNCILGSDGFGFAPSKDGYKKIHQLGRLIIGDNVEFGAGCTIDRGALEDTVIGNGVKLDNQVHIAHNVMLGDNSAIAAKCAIAGSTKIGKNLQMGGLSGIIGHLEICDNVFIGAHTLITKSISKPGNYVGIMPAQEHTDWAKSSVGIRKLSKK